MKAISIFSIIFMMLISSCGGRCKDDEVLHRTPESFNRALFALKNYQEWVFTNGQGEFDTLRAVGAYDPFWSMANRDGCDIYEHGQRNFMWNLFNEFCPVAETYLGIVLSDDDPIGCVIDSRRGGVCASVQLDFHPGQGLFEHSTDTLDTFSTPIKEYKNIVVFPLYISSYTGTFYYSLEDGPVGYVLETDTFKLSHLIK